MASPANSGPTDRQEPTPPRDGRPTPAEPIYRGLATSRSRASRGSVWLVAFVVSAVLHMLLIVVAPLVLRRETFRPNAILQAPPLYEPESQILVQLVEDPPTPQASPTPREASPVLRPPVVSAAPLEPPSSVTSTIPAVPSPGSTGLSVPPAGPPVANPNTDIGGGSVAQRLRPGVMDGRLWSRDPEAARFTPTQLAQLRILWAILDMNDSLAAAEAESRAMTDWTFTDASGGRWGIADGKIYLGDLTLPLGSHLGATPGSPAAQRAWVDAQIERSAAAATARANMNERIKAIRERIDRERRGVPPDTANRPR